MPKLFGDYGKTVSADKRHGLLSVWRNKKPLVRFVPLTQHADRDRTDYIASNTSAAVNGLPLRKDQTTFRERRRTAAEAKEESEND